MSLARSSVTFAAVLAVAVILNPGTARAESAPPAPGPDHGKMATEEATPVGEKAWEVEAAYSPTVNGRGTGSFDRAAHGHVHGFSLAAFYGVTEHLDVKVGAGIASVYDETNLGTGPTRGSGLTDLVLGSRWRFVADGARALDLTYASSMIVPIGRAERDDALGLTQGYWSWRNALVASKDWGRTTANAELAVTVPVGGDSGELDGALSANVAIGHAFLSWVQPFAELNYDVARDALTQQRLAATAGINMTAQSGTRLLAGIQQAVWGRNLGQTTTAVLAMKTAF